MRPARRPPADASAVWEIDSKIEDGAAGLHPTMKPVEVVRRPIEYHTKPGEADLRALLRLGHGPDRRRDERPACYALEQRAAFVDVAVARWERFTGKRRSAMARSTKAEIERRLAEVAPWSVDCMTLSEVRAWVDAKTAWGPRGLTTRP